MGSLVQFASSIGNLAVTLDQGIIGVARKAAKSVLRNVVKATPVDTGKARSNWQVGIGSAPPGPIGAYFPGGKLGLGESANASAAISRGLPVIDRFSGGELHITNEVPYIGELNRNKSPQAQTNFVEISARQAIENIRNAKLVP